MPRIFDNIDQRLLPALRDTLSESYRADFCVGYFNLRGWQSIDDQISEWTGGDGAQCRLLVGMQRLPQETLRKELAISGGETPITNQRALQLKKDMAAEFKRQLMFGVPTTSDESALRRLAEQIRQGRVVVKLFLRHPLHAKLYLLFRSDRVTPTVGYLGSSNLTFSGLSNQGELNVDVVDQDAAGKLSDWFDERWRDKFCIDISNELLEIIEESWAGEKLLPPYHVYLKMAYHLSREAREGLNEFTIPRRFDEELFDFQKAAVQIAARYLNRRGGVLIGDVVGLGKTIMATAVAKIFEEDFGAPALIICPKNLVSMWQYYREEYGLSGRVLSLSRVQQELPDMRRYRLVLIDESHNLRNRDGKRYRAIREYIERNESNCILLTATPYNKTYMDLSSQLRLFIQDDADLGIRPEALLREMGELDFSARHDVPVRSLSAFERSSFPDDWRDLMSLFMVRRTRSFIRANYTDFDPVRERYYLSLADGERRYFPERIPQRIDFPIDESDASDQYARLYAADVVDTINALHLPRYGLRNYIRSRFTVEPTNQERQIIDDLSRGGRRLMGFSRTNLFKRLESSGYAFLLSVERHILRNYIFLHALENGLPLPIGTQDAQLLDTQIRDEDVDPGLTLFDLNDDETEDETAGLYRRELYTVAQFEERAGEVYSRYRTTMQRRFRWLPTALFQPALARHLREDAENLLRILQECGDWDAARDAKLRALVDLAANRYGNEKLLIFSQFADTVRYLNGELRRAGIDRVAAVTGDSNDPTQLAWRFSPESNGMRDRVAPDEELRVLLATDVLSEGQNLQDCALVVNFDLPWAIIRLIQRAGRVDRIGQQADTVRCFMFWPAEGVERIINLRGRLTDRLRENEEVVGADEAFFEAPTEGQLLDLYHENTGVLDDDEGEIDLVSYAYQIWKNAIDADPALQTIIPRLPAVNHATKAHANLRVEGPPGALLYLRTAEGNSALAWVDKDGRSITHSQRKILDAAACAADEPALPRQESHYELVEAGVAHVLTETSAAAGGQLGRPAGARYRTYERLKQYLTGVKGTLYEDEPLNQLAREAFEQIYRYPLTERARDSLNRQLRSGVRDDALAELVVNLYEDNRLCVVHEREATGEPQIICSLGLAPGSA